MLNIFARASINRVVDPIGARLHQAGATPDLVTALGTVGTCATALWFFPHGRLLVGALVITVFALFDMLDGAVARARGFGTAFGAVLDSVCDRVADGALFAALTWWAFAVADSAPLAAAALICLVTAQVTSYVKARAEAGGLRCDVGLIERGERYVIALVGAGLSGVGVPFTINVALWALVVLSLYTVGQRMVAVRRSDVERQVR